VRERSKACRTKPARASEANAAAAGQGQDTGQRREKAEGEGTRVPYQRVLFQGDWPPYLSDWQRAGTVPATVEELEARVKAAVEEDGCCIPSGKEEEMLSDFRAYGKRHALLKLGVPLDMVLPGFPWSGEKAPDRVATKPNRKNHRALTKKALSALAKLSKALQKLAEEDAVIHPIELTYENGPDVYIIGGPPGVMASAAFAGKSREAWNDLATTMQSRRSEEARLSLLRRDMQDRQKTVLAEIERAITARCDKIAVGQPGRPTNKQVDEIIERLRSVEMSDSKIAEALKILGLEEAGDAKERVRKRRRRLKK
jgi:hypothetical protein